VKKRTTLIIGVSKSVGRKTTIGLAAIVCVGALAFFFFAPVIYRVIVPCNASSAAYVSPSYYLFSDGEAYFSQAARFAWLTHGPIDCI
jgi:hypothetical protein